MCSQSGLVASGKKHELVECLSQKNTEFDLHYGKIGSIFGSSGEWGHQRPPWIGESLGVGCK